MQKPLPEKFGITEAEIDALPTARNRFVQGIMWPSIVVTTALLFYGAEPNQVSVGTVLGTILVGCAVGFFVGLFVLSFFTEEQIESFMNEPETLRAKEEYDRALNDYWIYEAEQLRQSQEFWNTLSGPKFEQELARLFKRDRFIVTMTKATDDKGIDLYLKKGGRTTIVQCKRHKVPAGPAIARELYGTLVACGADDAILACPTGATRGTKEFLKGKPIRVMDVDDIIALQRRVSA